MRFIRILTENNDYWSLIFQDVQILKQLLLQQSIIICPKSFQSVFINIEIQSSMYIRCHITILSGASTTHKTRTQQVS